jgi:hypothetical protein
MVVDEERIDEAVLALLWLTLHDGHRAWKSFDWEVLGGLHVKGFIADPVGRAMCLEPRLAGRPNVRTLLLSCVRRPFFQLIPWRAKKRDRPLVLVWMPCSASRSRTSRRKRRGSCFEILRISPACASMRFEV